MNVNTNRCPPDTLRTAEQVAAQYHLHGEARARFLAAAAFYLLCGGRRQKVVELRRLTDGN